MFQTFDSPTRPQDGPPRLARLRASLAERALDGFLVPRADAHMGEYVAPRDERLSWLTGFTGSAGFCAVLMDQAGLFVDGRYTLQAATQAHPAHFTPVPWPKTDLADWLADRLPNGGIIGFDPWLHGVDEISKLTEKGARQGIQYRAVPNPIDSIWHDQPAPPIGKFRVHPTQFAGESHDNKCARLAADLQETGQTAAVLTLPDSIAWLLNIRGSDIPKNPVPHAFALLSASGTVDLFCHPDKIDEDLRTHLGNRVTLHETGAFGDALRALEGPVLLDKATAPVWVADQIRDPVLDQDPCILPKAKKTAAEIKGMQQAHDRDAIAIARFLFWLDQEAPKGALTEIDVVKRLEGLRLQDPDLIDISFDTICGAGPHGAIVHYRVTEETNRSIVPGDLLLIDSGGQYTMGTTDITRTIATGPVSSEQCSAFTQVLQGMIALHRVRWPRGLAGRDLDALARAPLWIAGRDFDHGTGHGVGAALSVHEGPQRISRVSHVPLEPGMILSNEPGYYRPNAFGIRLENLVHVVDAPVLPGGDDRSMLSFANLTWAPLDRRLVDQDQLSTAERDWLNTYHAEVFTRVGPHLNAEESAWLTQVCAPL